MPICESAQPASPAMPEPRPNAHMSTRPVFTPRHAAMSRFCVTPRTNRPNRVRLSRNQTKPRTNTAKPMIVMRLHGSTTLERICRPPDMNAGFSTCTFCAPKIVRTAWMRTRLIPQVASSVSSGRP